MPKIKLQTKRSNNSWVRNKSSQLSECLPFFRTTHKSAKLRLIHIVRYGTVYYGFKDQGDTIRHIALTGWCGAGGSIESSDGKKRSELLSELPAGEVVCHRCESILRKRYPDQCLLP